VRSATVITARLGSSRLPRKMLADLNGQSVLQRVAERVSLARRPDLLVLATTEEPEDDELVEAAQRLGLAVYRGPTEDVLVRWRDAARTYQADLIVNCDGDDVFCDPVHIDRVVECHERTGAEYITCSGLPFGAAPTGFALSGLERVCERKRESNTEGQGRFFEAPGVVQRAEVAAPASLGHVDARMTLDYPEDLEFFRAVLGELAEGEEIPTLEEIVALLRARPDLVAINAGLQERYWQRFNQLYQPVELEAG
jgi:spore coat polysaccharide biosynthesis protein SpsF (cytidylyltransferase family)